MAALCLSFTSSASLPRITPTKSTQFAISKSVHLSNHSSQSGSRSWTSRLRAAGLSEIEPDLNEDPVDIWRTPGIDPEDFEYGIYDGHHTYFETGEDEGSFWGAIADDIKGVGAPTGFQGIISWLFLPAVFAGMYYHIPGELLFGGAALFATVFVIIEMDKPDMPHNFEPQIYNMDRAARDKLISDYNSMSIWDFNAKYGELWDFTIKRNDLSDFGG